MVAETRFSKNVIQLVWFWWVWCRRGVRKEQFVDVSLVLLMFRESWFWSCWRVFGPIDFHDFRVCDFALFYCGFWMIVVFWGGLKGWNFDPRWVFKGQVDTQDSTSWGPHFGGSARTKIMKFHAFDFASFSLLKLISPCVRRRVERSFSRFSWKTN